MNPDQPILVFDGVNKSFSGIPVLKDVHFAVPSGHTLGLVGENGAGKSTLMNILGGNLQADAGRMWLNGQIFAPRQPAEAVRNGVAFIHQELNLFPNLSVAENLFLNRFPGIGRLPWINRKALRAQAADLLSQVGLAIPPAQLVERLSAGEQQLVEIAKALSAEPRLIILDEPTTSLTSREIDRLFALLEQLQGRGLSLIYISHNLDHVLRLCDDIVVLRDGEQVAAGPKPSFTLDRLVSLMVGRSITQFFPSRTVAPSAEPVLEVRHLFQPGIVEDITFTLHAREVLGISGLMGSGRSELARILFGLDPFARGQVLLKGQPISRVPRCNIERGLAFLTENRRDEGLCRGASVAENIALATLPNRSRNALGWIDAAAVRLDLEAIRRDVRLAASARNDAPVQTLSGGNQQKVVLAKWLLARPEVFILDEPTRGIDLGAKSEIYQLMNNLSARGSGVLIISSELEELLGLCDRILVMHRGEITDELRREEFDSERIMAAALGGRRPA